MAGPSWAQCGTPPGKDYVRLGGRVIAIENFPQTAQPALLGSGTSVTITPQGTGTTVYYTTNGIDPTCSSSSITTATTITVSGTTTVKAFASQAGHTDSAIASRTYTPSSVTLSPSSADFGNQQSTQQTFTLTSSAGALSNVVVSILPQGPNPFTAPTTCSGSGLSCTITVTFTPTAAPVLNPTLNVSYSAGSQTGLQTTATLRGTGISPTSLAFGSQGPGTSTTQPVTLNYSGSVSQALSVGNPGPPFTVSNTCNSSLAAGAPCTVNVTFAPAAAGSWNPTLSITDGEAGSPFSVPLSGNSGVTLSPATLAFGGQTVGTSSSQNAVLTNFTNAAITVSSVSANGAFSAPGNACPAPVAANGGTCTIQVTFTPTFTGNQSGSLTVTYNGPNLPPVQLTGTGGGTPQATLSPTSLSFGNVAMGQTSQPQYITVRNSGTAPLQVTMVTVDDSAEFLVTNGCPSSMSMAPGVSCGISVNYTPNLTGTHNTTLHIASNGGNVNVPLSGAGQNPVLAPPVFGLPSGAVVTPNTGVLITAPTGASLRFTTDSTNPSTSPTAQTVASPYSVTITGWVTILAVSRQSGVADSAVSSATYTPSGVVALAPSGVTVTSAQFTTFVMSADGGSRDSWSQPNDFLYLRLGVVQPPTNRCTVQFQPATQTVYLTSDDGLSLASGAFGSNTVLSNSQCTLNLAGSTEVVSDTMLTVSLPVAFSASYAGLIDTYLLVLAPVNGGDTPQFEGTDTIQANSITLTPPTATLDSGQQQQFTASTGVNWSVSPQTGAISAAGQYSSPATINTGQVVSVTATSQADPTKYATALITLVPAGVALPTDLHLTNLTILTGTPTYHATHTVTADTNVVIGGAAAVTFQAGTSVTLGPGFHATATSPTQVFHAVIR